MDTLQQFVAFFEKHAKKKITHSQLHIAKAIFQTNEGLVMFNGNGRRGGKTTFLTALEAFAHQKENELGGSVVPPVEEPPKE